MGYKTLMKILVAILAVAVLVFLIVVSGFIDKGTREEPAEPQQQVEPPIEEEKPAQAPTQENEPVKPPINPKPQEPEKDPETEKKPAPNIQQNQGSSGGNQPSGQTGNTQQKPPAQTTPPTQTPPEQTQPAPEPPAVEPPVDEPTPEPPSGGDEGMLEGEIGVEDSIFD